MINKLLVIISLLAATSFGGSGPMMTPFKVSYFYLKESNNSIYAEFGNGSMPGCYGNKGGYINVGTTFSKEIITQLLSMAATGGVTNGKVIFTVVTPNGGQWGDCRIEGFEIWP